MKAKGVQFEARIEHGVTHSCYVVDPDGVGVEILYELPREVWEGDLNAALNHLVFLPTHGEDALSDYTDWKVFAAPSAS